MTKTTQPAQLPSFEAALAELESIVTQMESGELPLERSLAAYQRGAELLKYCQSQLSEARERVRILEEGELKPFTDGQGSAD